MDQAKSAEQEISAQDPHTKRPWFKLTFVGRWSPQDTAKVQDAIVDALLDLDMKPSPRVELDFTQISD